MWMEKGVWEFLLAVRLSLDRTAPSGVQKNEATDIAYIEKHNHTMIEYLIDFFGSLIIVLFFYRVG